jgi:hypothetical protein
LRAFTWTPNQREGGFVGSGLRSTGRGVLALRFLFSLLKRKRPNRTQPFIPGSQSKPLPRLHLPAISCGQPQPLIACSLPSVIPGIVAAQPPPRTGISPSNRPDAARAPARQGSHLCHSSCSKFATRLAKIWRDQELCWRLFLNVIMLRDTSRAPQWGVFATPSSLVHSKFFFGLPLG